ncbi:MAG TPA: hypothetical protein VFB13_03365 [Reyranella sp.]|jgi:hypothetical protein|nr:hypothetical protein [Reyranella sp.]
MSWSATLYASFADEATCRAQLSAALGRNFTDVNPRTGAIDPIAGDGVNSNVVPFTQWTTWPTAETAGVAASGFWVMLKLDTSWSGYAAAMTALTPYLQTPATPSNKWAGE